MTILLKGVGSGAVAAAGTTWNPADKSADITLSGGDLVATVGAAGGYRAVRSTVSKTAGKWYFEVTANVWGSGEGPFIAICPAGASLSSQLGNATDEAAYFANGGYVLEAGSITVFLSSYGAGDKPGAYFDVDAGKVWFAKNGVVDSGDPAAGTGHHAGFTPGTAMFAATCLNGGSPGDKATGDFTVSSLGYSALA